MQSPLRSPVRPTSAALFLALGAAVAWPAAGLGAKDRGAEAVAPHFVEESAAAGLEHVYDGDWPFFVGGGVAAFDCDADGRPELYAAGGENPAALFHNDSPLGGALRFARLPSDATDLDLVTGAYPIDIDGDAVTDLVVLRRGENVVLRGLGDCRFERANEAWGIDGGDGWTVAFSAKWDPGASWPTLAFGDYLQVAKAGTIVPCDDDELIRPIDAAGATPAYGRPEALSPSWCTLSMLFSDWDRSGRRDLRVTNDRHYYTDGEDQLWRVLPDEAPTEYGRSDGWQRLRIWGMGIASQDLDGDGYPEVYLTSIGDNKLQTLAGGPGKPRFRDIALKRGVTATQPVEGGEHLPSTAWHAEFADVNNDARMDLFVSKGNVEAMPDTATFDPSDLFLGEPDGTFGQSAEQAGLVEGARGRGAAVVDLNLDGLLDIVKVNRRENMSLWRNVGAGDASQPQPMGHWLGVRLSEPDLDRDAIGAWLEVRAGKETTQTEVTIGGGHASGQLGWLHVGLGDAQEAEVRVQWPDGEWSPWSTVAADRFVTIERGGPGPVEWQPPAG